MCGIVGAFATTTLALALALDALDRPLAALVHRGPDGEGRWWARDGRVALGHRRLAIIDRHGGAQPIASEDGEVVVVVSGEFYDHAAIRRRLIARGHRFRSASDSEILVHLYEDHGIEAVHELRGEFAFLLWDQRRRIGYAARDRFGVRPLVHARIGDSHWFASEAKALWAAGAPRAWDEPALFAAAQLQYPPTASSLFAGIEALEPGQLAIIGARVETRRYWDLDYPREAELEAPSPGSEGEVLAAIAESFDEAVRVRLEAEVPIAFQLSGGLDSTAVVASAAASLGRPPVCFTVGFDRPGYDERELARASAAHVGAELHVVEVSAATIVAQFEDAVTRAEGLAINGHIAAKHLLAKTIRAAGFGVVLTGEGADEVFAGYAHLRRDLQNQIGQDQIGQDQNGVAGVGAQTAAARLAASNRASAGLMLAHGEGLELVGVERALGYVPAWMAAKASLGRRICSLLAEDWLAAQAGRDAYTELLAHVDVRGQLHERARVHQSAYLWSKTALATYILRTLGDGIEMASSLEGRVPFLDHRLFEQVRRLPIDWLIRGGVEKWVLREALAPRIPAAVRTREKHPFLAPPGTLVEQTPIQAVLRDGRLPTFVDRRKLVAVLERLPTLAADERAAWDPPLLWVASACILERSYGL